MSSRKKQRQRLEPGSSDFMKARAKCLIGYDDCLKTVASLEACGGSVVHSNDPEKHCSLTRMSRDGL